MKYKNYNPCTPNSCFVSSAPDRPLFREIKLFHRLRRVAIEIKKKRLSPCEKKSSSVERAMETQRGSCMIWWWRKSSEGAISSVTMKKIAIEIKLKKKEFESLREEIVECWRSDERGSCVTGWWRKPTKERFHQLQWKKSRSKLKLKKKSRSKLIF